MRFPKNGEEKRGRNSFLGAALTRTVAVGSLASIFMLMYGTAINAQALYGSIVGTVTDPSGSLLFAIES